MSKTQVGLNGREIKRLEYCILTMLPNCREFFIVGAGNKNETFSYYDELPAVYVTKFVAFPLKH